ncbi:ABC transporter permease [Brucella pseudogrignonensis]|uniref:ABC transporter permease n=1 Tax=Brucella pseudogrignonensis TaxID=419475 RepID=UPI0028B5392F|nr:ABC transporter permease [Brucella pseudogrignonensis]MDT6942431.1 ABC transporter permease [Brucella pseudogrignonensis]
MTSQISNGTGGKLPSGSRLSYNMIIATAVAAVVAVLLLALYTHAPTFFRFNNLINILVQSSIVGILAIGLTFVLIGGGIDLSMPATLALSGILGALAMQYTQSAWIGPFVMLASGAVIGTFNGIAVAFMRMAPFVVTLATMTIVGGAAVWVTGSQSISDYPLDFEDLFLVKLFGLPVSVWLFLASALIGYFVMERTVFGRFVRAVGFNPVAASLARVPVQRVLCFTYTLSGLLAALTGILLVARLGSASASLASDSLLLDIISACVIGRVSIYGGVGSPLQAALGAIAVTIISNSLNQLGVSYFASLVIKGGIIVLFVYLDKFVRRSA